VKRLRQQVNQDGPHLDLGGRQIARRLRELQTVEAPVRGSSAGGV
jgi:hypothetical protein